MYKNNFVVCVKSNGQIVREEKDIVKIPFDKEYSLLLKNLNNRKALVSVSIDGKDILNGRKLIVDANSSMELERLLGDDLNKGRKLKFIELSDKIKQYQEDKIDNGLIRVEFIYEAQKPYIIWNYPQVNYYPVWHEKTTYKPNWEYNTEITCDSMFSPCSVNAKSFNSNLCMRGIFELKDGITGKGSESNQSFTYGNIGELEVNSTVITLQLKGYKDNGSKIKNVITVNEKVICDICGTKNNSRHKYCFECGNYIE